jgi:hypothetical protein
MESESLLKGRLNERLLTIGAKRLRGAIHNERSPYSKGGAKVYARGILRAISSGFRNKVEVSEDFWKE